jgi:CRP-like cAMP-binding protein
MKELIDFLTATHLLTPQQIDFIVSKCVAQKIKAQTNISKPHKVPHEIAFIAKGVFRIFYIDDDGNEITKFLMEENNFIVDIDSYLNVRPSSDYIQSITPCDILTISRTHLTEIEQEIPNWGKITNQLITQSYLKKVQLISPMLHENATVRYVNFVKNCPNIATKIPLSFIASYLGITQQSLSRIRKNLS